MSTVFGKNNGRPNRVKRNTFDLSFQTNATFKFGGLYPVFCKEVLPGDSFRIRTTFGLRFMPTYFPLQTKMRVDLHYFYVRNRNLWKSFPDFITGVTSGLVSPFLAKPDVRTGSLADYFGVPTTVIGNSGEYSASVKQNSITVFDSNSKRFFVDPASNLPLRLIVTLTNGDDNPSGIYKTDNPYVATLSPLRVAFDADLEKSDHVYLEVGYLEPNALGSFDFVSVRSVAMRNVDGTTDYTMPEDVSWSFTSGSQRYIPAFRFAPPSSASNYTIGEDFTFSLLSSFPSGSIQDLSESQYKDKVFGTDGIRLSALPFRAYESIYNSFYRDDRNNPRLVDGQPVYNTYLRSTDGGPDWHEYPLYYRNWEQDFLTTCVPSPQQGSAPLVGISSTGVMTLEDPADGTRYQVQATTADDADTITGFKVTENLPTAVTRSLVNYATSGISINDFRNVNAFQRWKETNIRRGLKYKDQIKSHFDVDVKLAELDMPEFIGGVSEPVQINTVNQTGSDSVDSPLGSYAGQAYALGSSKHDVSTYCDEHGFIIGVLSVVPVPVYSQLLPKHFVKTSAFDYFFPEFGHIGLQPVLNSEVAPIQATVENKLNQTFGYQRPWYDYLASVDEVHGDFRTSLRDFVLSRVFATTPLLGKDFTTIRPDDLNHVFSVTTDTDKILGQVYFDVSAKRPIPMYGVPLLEADL